MNGRSSTAREMNKSTIWRQTTKLEFDGEMEKLKKKLKVENTADTYLNFETFKNEMRRRKQVMEEMQR